MRFLAFALSCSMACAGDPTAVEVELSPSTISSLAGTTDVAALVRDGDQPLADEVARITIEYRDRNGTVHDITPLDVRSDERGIVRGAIDGLTFDGTGTVTVELGNGVAGSATFNVLDRTPPRIEIVPPSADLRVGPGLPLDVHVKVSDEIGVSEVFLDGEPFIGSRSAVIASGTLDTEVTFRAAIPANAPPGPTVRLAALARDLSGNIAVAEIVTLTVDPAISIATQPDLMGSLLVEGTAQQLVDPRSLVVSPKDGHIYVADRAQAGACNPSCIWRIDATSGAIDPTPVVVGSGIIEGIAVDATGDTMTFSDRSNRVRQLAFDGTAYANPIACNDAAQQQPQDPMHLAIDPALGILVPDDNSQELMRVAACAAGSVGVDFSNNANFDAPRGIALGSAGEIFVSDEGRDRVVTVDRATGVVTTFEAGIEGPYGLEWVAGTSAYANSLLVASTQQQRVAATKGGNPIDVAFLRNSAIDVAIAGDTLYILTVPGNGIRGRVYKVTGF